MMEKHFQRRLLFTVFLFGINILCREPFSQWKPAFDVIEQDYCEDTTSSSLLDNSDKWLRAKWEHRAAKLDDWRMAEIARRNNLNYFWIKYLKPILVDRIPGTKNHELARNHIIAELKLLTAGWNVELDEFVDKPPSPYPQVSIEPLIPLSTATPYRHRLRQLLRL